MKSHDHIFTRLNKKLKENPPEERAATLLFQKSFESQEESFKRLLTSAL